MEKLVQQEKHSLESPTRRAGVSRYFCISARSRFCALPLGQSDGARHIHAAPSPRVILITKQRRIVLAYFSTIEHQPFILFPRIQHTRLQAEVPQLPYRRASQQTGQLSAMSGPSSSRGIKREREQSSDLYSIDDGPLAPEKR